MADEFEQLQPCSWRGIQFPTTSVHVSFSQDLAEHKYFGTDGARFEPTGRGPMQIVCAIPVVNGVVPGKNEKWGNWPFGIYPRLFRLLLDASANRTADIFIHPELGGIPCYVKSVDFKHEGQRRDGVEMTITFVETLMLYNDEPLVNGESPVQTAIRAIYDLDADPNTQLDIPELPTFQRDIVETLSQVGALADQLELQRNLARGAIDRYRHAAERLGQDVERLGNALLWPVQDATEAATAAMNWLKDHTGTGIRIGEYTVTHDIDLASLLQELPVDPRPAMIEILNFNPTIAFGAVIKPGTVVRYPISR